QSYFVPEADAVSNPSTGINAIKWFRTCPNTDGTQALSHSARVRIVVKDAQGAPLVGIEPSEIFALFNGGTSAQGFSGQGADSIIANFQYNQTAVCPNLRTLNADSATDASGKTYITLIGSTPGFPGVGSRSALRKWGH